MSAFVYTEKILVKYVEAVWRLVCNFPWKNPVPSANIHAAVAVSSLKSAPPVAITGVISFFFWEIRIR